MRCHIERLSEGDSREGESNPAPPWQPGLGDPHIAQGSQPRLDISPPHPPPRALSQSVSMSLPQLPTDTAPPPPTTLPSLPPPPPSPPPLPPGFRFVSDRASILARMPDIYTAFTQPEIYWGRDRTLETMAEQYEHSWRAVMILKGGEGSEGELAAYCRVVADGWDFGYLADVLTVSILLPVMQSNPVHPNEG